MNDQYIKLKNIISDSRNEFFIIITKKDASKEEFQSAVERNNELRISSMTALMDLHKILSEVVSDEDWPRMIKEFGKLIKY